MMRLARRATLLALSLLASADDGLRRAGVGDVECPTSRPASMIPRAFAVVGGALIAVGLAVFAYDVFGFVSHVVLWKEPERFGIAVGVLLVVAGVLLYRAGRSGRWPMSRSG